MSDQTAEQRFAVLAKRMTKAAGVTLGSGRRGFGSDALLVDGRIFAMVREEYLILKLPRERVSELLASREGAPFDAGKGRPMKEWVMVPPTSDAQWLSLSKEARAFVAGDAR
jgi:TfoX/Sxy family transcriptional regulator of competence genes